MEYEQSEPSGFKEREDRDWPDGVHIRQQDKGIIVYALFDGEEQVSEEIAPMQDEELIWFAEGYVRAKEKFDSESYDGPFKCPECSAVGEHEHDTYGVKQCSECGYIGGQALFSE